MPASFDFKKEYKDLYLPKEKPVLIDVPAMNFIMLDGAGDPNDKPYQEAVEVLYALSYTIKMSKKGDTMIPGYFEYVVPPLEGLWWVAEGPFSFLDRQNWLWTSMIRQPDFVTAEIFQWAVEQCRRKKPDLDVNAARLENFKEGLCVQLLHIGPYANEPQSVALMHTYMQQEGLLDQTGSTRKHHEIYLSDPRKTDPAKLKTVLRHPVVYT